MHRDILIHYVLFSVSNVLLDEDSYQELVSHGCMEVVYQ